jgi:hypothetical protein
MTIFLSALFVLLVAADTIQTYKILSCGGYRETGPLMRFIVKYPIFAVTVTVLATMLVLILIWESGFYLWLLPLCGGLLYALWHNWRVWHG